MRVSLGNAAAIVALVVSLLGAYQGLQTLSQDLAFSSLQAEVGFWPRESYQPTEHTRQQTDAALARLVQASPQNPDYLALRANQQAWESYWGQDKQAKRVYASNALAAQWQALEHRPAHRHSWQKLIQYSARGDHGAEYRAKAEKQLALLEQY